MIRTDDIAAVADCLLAGGVAMIPTDTVFGLAACPDKPDAMRRIFDLKQRPFNVNLPLLAPSAGAIAKLGAVLSPAAEKLLASELMPGALTLVLGLDPSKTPHWLAGREECAVRIPDDQRILRLLAITGPICATSANRHGAGNSCDGESLLGQLHGEPDILLSGAVPSETASTIINCRIDPYRIERQGPVAADVLERILHHG